MKTMSGAGEAEQVEAEGGGQQRRAEVVRHAGVLLKDKRGQIVVG